MRIDRRYPDREARNWGQVRLLCGKTRDSRGPNRASSTFRVPANKAGMPQHLMWRALKAGVRRNSEYQSKYGTPFSAGSVGVLACIVRITEFADQSRTPALPASVPVIDVVPVRFRVQCEHPELLEFANGLGTPASAFHRCQKRPGPGCRLWFR